LTFRRHTIYPHRPRFTNQRSESKRWCLHEDLALS